LREARALARLGARGMADKSGGDGAEGC
jgi:hypothetical protein